MIIIQQGSLINIDRFRFHFYVSKGWTIEDFLFERKYNKHWNTFLGLENE